MGNEMEKTINFKIIELPDHQALIMKDFDDSEESKPQIVFMVFLEGVKMEITLGFENEEKRDDGFDKFDSERAQEVINGLKTMMQDE